MRRDNDKYQFKEPFGRDIRKKMIESQRKALTGLERNLKLGQLKPTVMATVGHVASGLIQPERKPVPQPKAEKKPKNRQNPKENKKKKGDGEKKGKKRKKTSNSDVDEPVETKKANNKKGDSKPKTAQKSISDISLVDFDNIRDHFPGMPKNDIHFATKQVFLKILPLEVLFLQLFQIRRND